MRCIFNFALRDILKTFGLNAQILLPVLPSCSFSSDVESAVRHNVYTAL
jgi:hypothetical protein